MRHPGGSPRMLRGCWRGYRGTSVFLGAGSLGYIGGTASVQEEALPLVRQAQTAIQHYTCRPLKAFNLLMCVPSPKATWPQP